MIVLVLLGMVMFLAVPTFQVLLEGGREREINRLSRVVRLVRNQAILTHTGYRLVWDLKQGQYVVEQRTRFGEYVPAEGEKLLAPHTLPAWFVLNDITVMGDEFTRLRETKAPVQIDPSGFIDQFLVHFSDEGEPWTLKVMGFSARMSVEPGHTRFTEKDR